MNPTYTPSLAPDVLGRLAGYAAGSRDDLDRPRQVARRDVSLRGLITGGDRKGVGPMAARVPLPPAPAASDPDPACSSSSARAPGTSRAGRPETLRKRADRQCAVGVHSVAPAGHHPLGMRLGLPDSRLEGPARPDEARVPEGQRRSPTEGRIAPELLDRARAEGLPGGLVVADSGSGASGPSGAGPAERGPRSIVGVTDEMVVSTGEPGWGAEGRDGRPAAGAPPTGRGPPGRWA